MPPPKHSIIDITFTTLQQVLPSHAVTPKEIDSLKTQWRKRGGEGRVAVEDLLAEYEGAGEAFNKAILMHNATTKDDRRKKKKSWVRTFARFPGHKEEKEADGELDEVMHDDAEDEIQEEREESKTDEDVIMGDDGLGIITPDDGSGAVKDKRSVKLVLRINQGYKTRNRSRATKHVHFVPEESQLAGSMDTDTDAEQHKPTPPTLSTRPWLTQPSSDASQPYPPQSEKPKKPKEPVFLNTIPEAVRSALPDLPLSTTVGYQIVQLSKVPAHTLFVVAKIRPRLVDEPFYDFYLILMKWKPVAAVGVLRHNDKVNWEYEWIKKSVADSPGSEQHKAVVRKHRRSLLPELIPFTLFRIDTQENLKKCGLDRWPLRPKPKSPVGKFAHFKLLPFQLGLMIRNNVGVLSFSRHPTMAWVEQEYHRGELHPGTNGDKPSEEQIRDLAETLGRRFEEVEKDVLDGWDDGEMFVGEDWREKYGENPNFMEHVTWMEY